MTGFVLHPHAAADLEEIWEYIAADSSEAADRVLGEISDAIKSLVAFPLQGHTRSDLTSRPIRFQLVREFLVAYVPEEKPLLVLAILHGRRSPLLIQTLLRGRG